MQLCQAVDAFQQKALMVLSKASKGKDEKNEKMRWKKTALVLQSCCHVRTAAVCCSGLRSESGWRLSGYSLGTWFNYMGLETHSDL